MLWHDIWVSSLYGLAAAFMVWAFNAAILATEAPESRDKIILWFFATTLTVISFHVLGVVI